MQLRKLTILAASLALCAGLNAGLFAAVPAAADPLAEVIQGTHRTADFKLRDQYRHPYETLTFFGIKPDMTVVELWPGGGWYTEILAPYLNEQGQYIAAGFDQDSTNSYMVRGRQALEGKLASNPELYGKAKVTELAPPDKVEIAPPGTADMVLTFRNLHNWMGAGQAEAVLAAAYKALKPGGILGLVEHRGDPNKPQDPKAESGYVTEAHAIALAEAAGFKLEDKSEINANPKDTRDHPKGVWTLPPALRGDAADHGKYLAIGESDRMTLRFRKPE